MATNSEEFLQFQSEHQKLLARYEQEGKSQSLLPTLLDYVQSVREQAEIIEAAEDRRQLRANIDFWASIVYEISGTYPNTKLASINPTKVEILRVEELIYAQEKLRGIIPHEQLEGVILTLQEKLANLKSLLSGEGSIVQGDHNVAAGEHSVYISGEVSGDIVTNIIHQRIPLSEEQREQIKHRYLHALIRAYSKSTLRPLDPSGQTNYYPLQEIYVELETTTYDSQEIPDRKTIDINTDQRYLSALEATIRYSRLVILGDPGSGKTTFVHHLALTLSRNYLGLEATLGDLQLRLLPLLINFRNLAQRLATVGSSKVSKSILLDIMAAQWMSEFEALGVRELFEPFRDEIAQGNVLLIFDGLDEVPIQLRSLAKSAILALQESFPAIQRIIVTSRIILFDGFAGFKTVTLAPFNTEQIEQFISIWYMTLANSGEMSVNQAQEMSHRLQSAIIYSLGLRELAQNPMLLTILAIVQTNYGTLPLERARLYQASVETLLFRWQQHKEGAYGSNLPNILMELDTTQAELERLLQAIAWEAHTEVIKYQSEGLAEFDVLRLARTHLGSLAKAENFLAYAEQRAQLLIARGGVDQQIYTFPHRTFQEYLAACHLTHLRRLGRQAAKLATEGEVWREVLKLAAEILVYNAHHTEKVLDVIDDMLPRQTPSREDAAGWRQVWLAAEMMNVVGRQQVERDEVGQELLPRLRELVVALIVNEGLLPYQRAEAGKALAFLGDPRPGVSSIEPTMVDIPSGTFLMGSSKDRDSLANKIETPQHLMELPAYQISKYPITVMQYKYFVEDGGYTSKWQSCWTEVGWQRKETQNLTEPRFWQDSRWNVPNFPIVGISWYEAVAYCNWLEKTTGRNFRLPNEAMWEKAARGTDGQIFAWGNEWDSLRLNADETGIGQIVTVGLFPSGDSPYGCADMCGNVWEWTSSPFSVYPFEKSHNHQEHIEKAIVIRGGSAYSGNNENRCAARQKLLPNISQLGLGFRVVSLI